MDFEQLHRLVIACQNPEPKEPWEIPGNNTREKIAFLKNAIIVLEKAKYQRLGTEQALKEWQREYWQNLND